MKIDKSKGIIGPNILANPKGYLKTLPLFLWQQLKKDL